MLAEFLVEIPTLRVVCIVCTLKKDGKHDLLALFLPEDKNKTQLSLSRLAREVAGDVS